MNLRPETVAAQALGEIDVATGAVIPPIHLATTFQRNDDGTYPQGNVYLRTDSPTVRQVERVLTQLEAGADAKVFGSGMSAALACIQSVCRPGDHLLIPSAMYWSLRSTLLGWGPTWGVEVELVDMGDLAAVNAALRPGRTRLVWIETPANPTWEVTDIAAVADLAHRAGARLAVDSTVGAAVFTLPLMLGADWVMHSATKYLNGHSDVLAGALVCRSVDEQWAAIGAWRSQTGAVLGPMEAWLLLRGLRTLHVRVARQAATAQLVAEALVAHPAVASVAYPGLASHAGHAIAARQMCGGFGGMLSIRIHGGETAARAVANRLELWVQATSLGGTESLVEHRASVEGAATLVPRDLLRLSVGLEHPDDLIADLHQALEGS